MAAVEELSSLEGGRVLDVPAGGGYLQKYLPPRFDYQPFEPVKAFNNTTTYNHDSGLLPFPQLSCSVDAILSVAGIHHFSDKKPLFIEMARVTKPGGRLVLADVHCKSLVASFLDGYIDRNNSTGHHGYYLGEDTLEELESCGWNVASARRKHYHWNFTSLKQMARFCELLFDINRADTSQIRVQLEDELGVDMASGGVGLRWDLYVISASKNTQA